MRTVHYHLGCPVWSNRDWVGRLFGAGAKPADWLTQYSAVFGAVEGNNTFYGLPRPETVARWMADAAPGFRFCFKFPRRITHEFGLRGAERETREFLGLLAPLATAGRLGPLLLQLPAEFGPEQGGALLDYLDALPAGEYAVEVRHPAFFAKGEAEIGLNRTLRGRGVDRVVLDSRALFSTAPPDAASRIAQGKKPRLPVHPLALGRRPLVRYIGHIVPEVNRRYLEQWADKLAAWLAEGREPYFFIHTPDNLAAPELARGFHALLRARAPDLPPLPEWPAERARTGQLGLF